MKWLLLAWKNIGMKPMSAVLSVLLFATGVGLMVALLLVETQTENQFRKNMAGIDMVVGAKGSPIQLILSSIYHVDYPTGNIDPSQTKFIENHPMVEQTIPISVGDNYKAWRVVGTTVAYPELYEMELRNGAWFSKPMEVTVGSKVAERLNLKVGDAFYGGHNLDTMHSHVHDHHAYTVVGVMETSNTVLDQLLLTPIESYWVVHDLAEDERNITSLLVTFKAAHASLTVPRQVNESTQLQAANPTMESARLVSVAGAGAQGMQYLVYIVLSLSGLSIFIALLQALKDRKYELAVLRVMGASRFKLVLLVLLEGTILAFLGIVAGLLLGHLGMSVLGNYLQETYHYSFSGGEFLFDELYIVLGGFCAAWIAAILPAIVAYRTSISKTLAKH